MDDASSDHEGQSLNAVELETTYYNTLVNDGGRPSHPISLLEAVVSNPGQYREILSFWQDHPDEWEVFGKELERWQGFRDRQRTMREQDGFAEYAIDVKDRLARHNFKRPFQLNKDLSKQDKLTTWIEYLNHEYRIRNHHAHQVKLDQQRYDHAWKKLVDSNVLDASETENSICRTQSIIERVPEREKRLVIERNVSWARRDFDSVFSLYDGPKCDRRESEQLLERKMAVTAEREKAEDALSTLKRRKVRIAEFMKNTSRYRRRKGAAERCDILLRWILNQVPLIELELNPPKTSMHKLDWESAGDMRHNHSESPPQVDQYDSVFLLSLRPIWSPNTMYSIDARDNKSLGFFIYGSTATARTFHPFQHLPYEIRFKIWGKCLPPRPTVHFFDVINHRLAPHHQHLWSNKEVRLRASRDHVSGYRYVLPLMSTCREARATVAWYYSRPSPGCLAPASATSPSQTDGSDTSTPTQRNLAPLDWIPQDDLIILCLPPRVGSRFPATHDITLAGRPHVGFAVPLELLDCVNVQSAVPQLLLELECSKLPRIYLLSRLQAFKPHFQSHSSRSWIQREAHWSGNKNEYLEIRHNRWEEVVGARAAGRWYWSEITGGGRWFWWVGGNRKATVGTPRTGDDVSGRTIRQIIEFAGRVRDGLRDWGLGKCKIENLGWMYKERSGGNAWESDEGD